VRIWREHAGAHRRQEWRGYIQDVEGRRHMFFLDFDQMVRFIVQSTGARLDPSSFAKRAARWLSDIAALGVRR
jgi:hypothetical protein